MSDDTARRFMQVADKLEDKFRTVRDLPPTVLYQLASPSTPEPIREEFMREAEAAGGATAEQIERVHSGPTHPLSGTQEL